MAWAIMILGVIVMLVGGIWLLVVAFKQSVVWGLVVLFVPFAALVFVVKYWDVTKTAFVVNLVGAVMYGGMFYGVIKPRIEHNLVALAHARAMSAHSHHQDSTISDDLDSLAPKAPDDRAADNTGAARKDAATSAESPKAQAVDTAPEAMATNADSSAKPLVIRVADARKYIGQLVRVTGKNHVVREAMLREVHGDALVFERRVGSGSLIFRMHAAEIAHLESMGLPPGG